MTNPKYLTNQEKDHLITEELGLRVEKLEKKYKCTILFNIDDIIFKKNEKEKRR